MSDLGIVKESTGKTGKNLIQVFSQLTVLYQCYFLGLNKFDIVTLFNINITKYLHLIVT